VGGGGAAGTGGTGGTGNVGGTGNAGGTGGIPTTWPNCGPASGLPIKLYTTLNDAASIQSPANGTGPGTHNPSSAFATGACGAGFLLDASGEYVSYPGDNIELSAGTIDFWYVPDDPETDPRIMDFFATSDFTNGGIKISKRSGTEGNTFEVVLVTEGGVGHPTRVSPDWYTFVQGKPIRITVVWSTGMSPAGAPAVSVWFDKSEVTSFVTRAQLPITMPTTAPAAIYVGAEKKADPTPANGVIDEFKIFSAPLAIQ